MPISSNAGTISKKNPFKVKNKSLTPIASELATKRAEQPGKKLSRNSTTSKALQRSNSSLCTSETNKQAAQKSCVQIHTDANGTLYVSRTKEEKLQNEDRLCLDKRGLSTVPFVREEPKLRLLSMQHNLINSMVNLQCQSFPHLVFLDIYNNQIDSIPELNFENLRVLLLGKNRISKVEGLKHLKKLEVLDLHGNQILQISGLAELSELKVLNMAGNQVRSIAKLDLEGLCQLQELNLRRNRLKRLIGFGHTPNLQKLFISNNELENIEDMKSVAKSVNIKELCVDNNPVALGSDCIPFLISYLPKLTSLNTMLITDQLKKAASTWRRNKESTNPTFMDLTIDLKQEVHREEVISNARMNWELIKSQAKCVTICGGNNAKETHVIPNTDIILTSYSKPQIASSTLRKDVKRTNITRTSSQETDNSQNSNNSEDFFKLPPILVPIINKMQQDNVKKVVSSKASSSSIGPNIDSSVSSLINSHTDSSDGSSSSESEEILVEAPTNQTDETNSTQSREDSSSVSKIQQDVSSNNTETSSNLSTNTSISTSGSDLNNSRSIRSKRSVRSAGIHRVMHKKVLNRASTAKPAKQIVSPSASVIASREREQGGDYLIEISGRHLNVFGQGALHYIDKSWSPNKTTDVTTINFNYANFNFISAVLGKIKNRFPNAEHFVFKETNITNLGQINALAEIQGFSSLTVSKESNPINEKDWTNYAIYRLSHWGLKVINGYAITEEDVKVANEMYQSLSDIVFWTLPDMLLLPLLKRLRIDVNSTETEVSPKLWLMSADPALRSVVSKEALQFKKSYAAQEELVMRHKAKCYLGRLLQDMCDNVKKLRLLDEQWPTVLYEIVHNSLIDYSQLDIYMRRKLQQVR